MRLQSIESVSTISSSAPLMQICNRRRPQFCVSHCSIRNHSQKSTNSDISDKVDIGPGTWKEIYHGILTTQIRMVKLFSLSTSCLGLLMQPVLLQKFVGTHVGLAIATGSFIGFFTFVTPLLIHWITKKYVTRLEYDPERDIYSATILTFFLREKKIDFSLEDVEVPSVPGMFTTFHVKKHPLFVEPRMFEDVEHYGRLMGYDKPIDFSIDDDEDEKK